MKFDFSKEEYFDNHTHVVYKEEPLSVTADEFAINYYHGVRDTKDENGKLAVSEVALEHLPYQCANMVIVNAISERFGVEPTLEAVTKWRNSQTETPEKLAAYTRMLYEDENVTGCTLDSELPMGHPDTEFPCRVFRLFRYEDSFHEALAKYSHFEELLDYVLKAIRKAKEEGFVGLKGHIGDKFAGGFKLTEVSDAEAEKAMAAAKMGEAVAISTVYRALFGYVIELAGQLDMPLNLHTGTTGFKNRIVVYEQDPILMADYLKNPRYYNTKIVLLHGSFPYTRNAAWMAYNFPNVYCDLSQTQLWQGILCSTLLDDTLSCVPHDKIILGTGQHGFCEMAWLASRIAKHSLAQVMTRVTDEHLLSTAQAEKSARMILSENAFRLYGA